MAEPLKFMDGMFSRDHGAWMEGEIFAALRESLHVARSFEFGLVDGGINCTEAYDPNDSYADRFLKLWRSRDLDESKSAEYVLFECKSTKWARAGGQVFKTFKAQLDRAAFFICVYAGNSQFVDVIPNLKQDPAALDRDLRPGDEKHINVNTTRLARLCARAYGGLDPCSSPYRMPFRLLPEAIKRIRDCANGKGPYINPWTRVEFDWKPAKTSQTRWFAPVDTSAAYTGLQQTVQLLRSLRSAGRFHSDFVYLQPRLADIRIGDRLIQLKWDTSSRPRDWQYDNVLVARATSTRINNLPSAPFKKRYFFTAFERFDFILYQFDTGGSPPRRLLFLIPEKEIPNEFYVSKESRQDFSRFLKYKIDVDSQLKWVRKVEDILSQHPHPRMPGYRPLRDIADLYADDEEEENDEEDYDILDPTRMITNGRHVYEKMLSEVHDRFYRYLMAICAHHMSCILVLLARNHSTCDFGFARYGWTENERRDYLELERPPQVFHTLHPEMPIVPICVYGRSQENWHQGPSITAAQFRRLDSDQTPRIIVWDLHGPDVGDRIPAPVAVPSDDIGLTANQVQLFQENLELKNTLRDWDKKAPGASDLLKTGLMVSQYTAPLNPLNHDKSGWSELWSLLEKFTRQEEFSHPVEHTRDPSRYRCTVKSLNDRLKVQHQYNALSPEQFEEPLAADIDD